MDLFTFAAGSLEHVLVPVRGKRSGTAIDPTADTVKMAFLDVGPETGSPESGDWKTASWETNTTVTPNTYEARCLVGPGGGVITLTEGTWHVWVQVTDSPETPGRYSGRIRVTP